MYNFENESLKRKNLGIEKGLIVFCYADLKIKNIKSFNQ